MFVSSLANLCGNCCRLQVADCRLQVARPFVLLCGWQVKAATVRTVQRRPYLRALYSRDLDCIATATATATAIPNPNPNQNPTSSLSPALAALYTHTVRDTTTALAADTDTLVAFAIVADAACCVFFFFFLLLLTNGKLLCALKSLINLAVAIR